ncbi:serine hydrolase [Streptomyces sp. H27-H1]|uniref:serine hydrolase n=1 Tax=Streptomyces sp. H27-H1 TaxID=2996461 RepID=UPI0022718CEB|nr:serine hydrolase [Streptomyces sp. H27-H1]MCY0931637.1 serine hydrolase [Streptomyces sp. H27-H1]
MLGPHRRFDAASVVKPVILGALLWARHGELSPQEKALARKMIVESDNDATEVLWKELSTAGTDGSSRPVKLEQFLRAVHMDETVPDPDGSFGLTRVTAPDLVKLLRAFRGEGGVLTPAAGSYALGLMRDVEADQRWGTPASAPVGAEVHVKNGWLQRTGKAHRPADRGDWRINSMAAFTGRGYDYDLVVLTENNRAPAGHPAREGYLYGIDTIEAAAKAVNMDLRAVGKAAGASPPMTPDRTVEAALALGGTVVGPAGHRMLVRNAAKGAA